MSVLPNENRDSGPYESFDQLKAQFDSWAYGLPPSTGWTRLLVQEACLIAKIEPSPFEIEFMQDKFEDSDLAQLVAGWIIRAHLAGLKATTSSEDNR